jgi:hypothetical protein
MSSKNEAKRLRRRRLVLLACHWTEKDVAKRLWRGEEVRRWVEQGRALWQVEPDGVSVMGLREQLLDLFDTIVRCEDETVRMFAGEEDDSGGADPA